MWSVPAVTIKTVEPCQVTAEQFGSGVAFTITGTGFQTSSGENGDFDIGPFVAFLKHGSVLTAETFSQGLFNEKVACDPPMQVSFTLSKSTPPDRGSYDLLVAQPENGTVRFVVKPNALQIT